MMEKSRDFLEYLAFHLSWAELYMNYENCFKAATPLNEFQAVVWLWKSVYYLTISSKFSDLQT